MNYNTKQKREIYDLIKSFNDEHFTVDMITKKINEKNMKVGQTTVYRFVEELLKKGELRKFMNDNVTKACFQFVDNVKPCINHFHMICEKCGNLYHLDCDEIEHFMSHIKNEHKFSIDISRVVFYGTCEKCLIR